MINIKAVQTTLNIGPQAGKDRFVMQAMSYSTLTEAKVIAETAARTNMSKQLIRACWEGCAEIIKAWATEGHSIPIPGLGHMRFGIRATSVEKVEDVKANLITSRRVIFIPSVEIKEELAKTSISITCYDKDGKKIKTVTSADTDDIEVDNGSTEANDSGSGSSQSSSTSGTNSGGSNGSGTNSGSNTGGNTNTGSNTGGNTNTGSNTGGNSGSQSGSGESGVPGDYKLNIFKYGSGTSTVTDANNQEINSGDTIASGTTVNISVVPAAGKVPTAKINGSTTIALTENNGTYTGSFQMPMKGTVLEVNSEPSDIDWGDSD
jgi:nucleoid DNA-binding protein